MNNHDRDRDELLDAYHRAGDPEAGRPAESTRRAILEGARSAARSRQPAANDSRYAWSAVAGIAVLGIAVLLWRQADPRVAVTASAPAPAVEAEANVEVEVEVETRSTGSRNEALAAADVSADAAASKSASRQEVPERPAAAIPAESVRSAEFAPASAPVVAATAAPPDEGARKLRTYFPDAWASGTPPATVWIIEGDDGLPMRQGTLAEGEALPRLTSDWTVQTTENGAGIPVRVATAREPLP